MRGLRPQALVLVRAQTPVSQVAQLHCSGLTFINNRAAVAASVLFSEADIFQPLTCAPTPCDASVNNTAAGGRQKYGTPPTVIGVNMSTSIRSGGTLPISLTLIDGFGQQLKSWADTTAVITTTAALSGSLRTFFANGAAVFSGLTLRGDELATYTLTFTITGPDLFGNGITSKSASANVTIQACSVGETFDKTALACTCATGYGLVVETGNCEACTANQVVPLDAAVASCATCPPLSAPYNMHECRCNAGYFGARLACARASRPARVATYLRRQRSRAAPAACAGTIVGATGECLQCPLNTFRSEADPPASCIACPNTSQTFALGTTSAKGCMCGSGSFTDTQHSANGSFTCSAVPSGGWSPQADPRLFALADYWRPSANYSDFWKCPAGNCLREVPLPNATQTGFSCRAGHMGHLCAVCEPHWAYQGVYCKPCAPGTPFREWSAGKKFGLLFFGCLLVLVVIFFLFFLPICPRVEAALHAAMQPAAERVAAAVDAIVPRRSRMSGVRMSGASRPTSASRPRSAAKRRLSSRAGALDVPTPKVTAAAQHKARGARKLAALLDVISEPVRIVISF